VPGRFARRTAPAGGRRKAPRPAQRRAASGRGDPGSDAPRLPQKSALQRAFVRLAWRDQSREELRRGLAREGFESEAIDQALERLVAARMLDDRAFAERHARRSLGRGLGRKRIGFDLSARGVGRAEAHAGLAEALQTLPESEVLGSVARRYWKQHARVEPRARLRRAWAFLIRRGFPAPDVARCLRGLCPGHDDDLETLSTGEA
jgi:regulatory protein